MMQLKKIGSSLFNAGEIKDWNLLPKSIKVKGKTYGMLSGFRDSKDSAKQVQMFIRAKIPAVRVKFKDRYGIRYATYVKKTRGITPQVASVRLVSKGYADGEWANQFYTWHFVVDGDEVEISSDLVNRGNWSVIWEGAVDYDGNKKDLLARYPEFRKYLG